MLSCVPRGTLKFADKGDVAGGTKEGLDRAAIWNWHGHARHTIVISDRANIGGRSDEATYEAEQRALFR